MLLLFWPESCMYLYGSGDDENDDDDDADAAERALHRCLSNNLKISIAL